MKLIGTPLEHQIKAIQYLKDHHYCINGDEMGLGKTFDSIACSIGEEFTLIVCPAFLKYNWKADYDKFTNGAKVQIIETKKDIEKSMTANVAIVNYEKIESCEDLFKRATLVVCDEAHYLKNLEAKRTSLLHSYIRKYRPNRLQLLTGTPVKNRVEEFYSLLLLMSYSPMETNGKSITDKFKTLYSFARYFSNEVNYQIHARGRAVNIRKFEGLRNEQELKSYFKDKYIRRKTADVIDLPELRNKIVYANYGRDDNDLKEAFEQFEKGIKSSHFSTAKAESALLKSKFTSTYAKNIYEESGSSVVIFTEHVKAAFAIAEELKSEVVITGQTPIGRRHKFVEDFQAGKHPYFIATIGAASTGLTLTNASHLIFNDLSFVPADNAQAKKRIHRIGQKNTCHIHFIAGSVVDRSIISTLQTKMDVISKII